MGEFEVPGASVSIVERDHTVVAQGYGVRRLGENGAVDDRTVFPIGSITKGFTAAVIAMLVEDGRLEWDDKVVDRLPGFRMYDPYVSANLTIRDLLSHRSGLATGAGDLLVWPETTFSSDEIVRRIRYIRPSRPFRARYGYSNVLYVAAGELIGQVTGEPWGVSLAERVFAPLRMVDARLGYANVTTENKAWPHARLQGPVRGIGPVEALGRVPQSAHNGAAGAIYASAADMARWIRLQLARGMTRDGKRLFSVRAADEMWRPHVFLRTSRQNGALAETAPHFLTYGLGWFIRDYRGERVVTHMGGVQGGVSLLLLLPDRDVGFCVLTNSEEVSFLQALELTFLDHYLGHEGTDWIAVVKESARRQQEETLDNVARDRLSGGPPSLPLRNYAGTYTDAWYGTITIQEEREGLRISFDHSPTLSGPLVHVRHDTFRTQFPKGIEDAFVTFALNPDGTIARVDLQPVSAIADFSFDYEDLKLIPEGSP